MGAGERNLTGSAPLRGDVRSRGVRIASAVIFLIIAATMGVPSAVGNDAGADEGPVALRTQKRPSRSAARSLSPPLRFFKMATTSVPVAQAALAPSNDLCSNPDEAFDGLNSFTTIDAGTDGGELPSECQAIGFSQIAADVWFEYIATCTGDLTVSLCSSDFDTKLAVYAGCGACPVNDPVACNDDAPESCSVAGRSQLTTTVDKSDCFTIRVGGFVDDPEGTGTLVITCDSSVATTGACCDDTVCIGTGTLAECAGATGPWVEGEDCATFDCPPIPPQTGACCDNGECLGTVEESECIDVMGLWFVDATCPGFVCPPANDLCENAIEIFSDIPFAGSTVNASGSDVSSCGLGDRIDVWHAWRAEVTGPVGISSCGSTFGMEPTVTIAVFEACGGSQLACDDTGCGGTSKIEDFMALAGETYFIRVSATGPGNPVGNYVLTVKSPARACCFFGGGFNDGCLDSVVFPQSPSECRDLGGTPHLRDSVCLGDSDGNGVDDLCEGLPDFDQNQDFDGLARSLDPLGGLEDAYGGPTAVADLLWWFHLRFPTLDVVPIGVTNVEFIQDLAERMGTNGQTQSPFGHATPYRGTWLDDLQAGLRAYLNVQGLRNIFEERVELGPSFQSVVDHITFGDHVTLLLGFYRIESFVASAGGFDVQWRRTGGHYVTVGSVDSPATTGRAGPNRIAISDPDEDAAGAPDPRPGTVRGGDHDHDGDGNPATTPAFGDAAYDHTKHNTETLASHDFFEVAATTGSDPLDGSAIPGGRWIITTTDPATPAKPPALVYGDLLADFHLASSGGAFDVPGTFFLSDGFRTENGYPTPAPSQTYTVVEAAIVLGPARRQACCLIDGACTLVSPLDCRVQGDTPAGPGSTCLNDRNRSGADDACEACPIAVIDVADPASGTFDPRQSHAAANPLPRQGIGAAGLPGSVPVPIEITLLPAVSDAQRCFTLSETSEDPMLGPNSIINVIDRGGGVYRVVLEHAIAAGAVTTIRYARDAGCVEYTSHPSNADRSTEANANDLTKLTDCCLLGICDPSFGLAGCDMDRSGGVSPADRLRLIDLLRGGGTFEAWETTTLPSIAECP